MSMVAAILKFFKSHFLPNSESGWAETWWASEWIAESFNSNIQYGGHGGKLETLQTTSAFWIAKDNLIWKQRRSPWYSVAYHDQPNPGEWFLARLVFQRK